MSKFWDSQKNGIQAVALAALMMFQVGCSKTPEENRDSYMRSGMELMEKKDYARAVLAFRNAAKAVPKDAEPQYQLARASQAMGDALSAAEFLHRALALNPQHAEARLQMAELLASSRHTETVEEGKKLAQELLATSPGNLKALNILALSEMRTGQIASAAARLEQALARFPSDYNSAVNLARARMAQNDTSGAEAILRKAVEASPGNAQALFALADFYVLNGNTDGALDNYSRGLAAKPDHGPALSALGTLQARLGRPEAGATFRRLAANPDPRYRFANAAYLFSSGQRDAAISEFEAIYKKTSSDREARTYLITAYLSAGRAQIAEQMLSEAISKNPLDAEALLHRARVHLSNGKVALADKDIQMVLQSHADSAEAHYLMSHIHRLRRHLGLQQQELNETLRVAPSNRQARIELAQLLLARGDAAGSIAVLDAAPPQQKLDLPLQTQRTWALMALGKEAEAQAAVEQHLTHSASPELLLQDATLKARKKNFTAANASIEKILAAQPENIGALELMMQIGIATKDVAQAADRLRRHASQHPNSARIQLSAGILEQQLGRIGSARAAFELAKKIDPGLVDAELRLVDLDLAEDKTPDARRRLTALLSSERQAEAHSKFGQLEERAGNIPAACDHYRKTLDLNPRDIAVLNNLAYALAEYAGKPDEALKYAQQAKELAPYSAAIDDTLGWIYFRKGIYPNAVRHLEYAVKREPTARRVGHLAMAYAKLGDQAKARQSLQAALKLDPKLPEAAAITQAVAVAKP